MKAFVGLGANLGDPRLIDPEGIAGVAAAYPDRLVGIKMMATAGTVGGRRCGRVM